MPKNTRRTPALAYLVALIAVLLVWAAYRPLVYTWRQLVIQTPSMDETVELLSSSDPKRQREGLALASRMTPLAADVVTLLSELAFTASDLGIRQQAAQYLSGKAQYEALPVDILQQFPAPTPEMAQNLGTTYAGLIKHAVRHYAPTPNAVAFLDLLIEQGEWNVRNEAILAFGEIGFYHGLEDRRIAHLTEMATRESELGHQMHSADAAWALKLVGQKRRLPPATLETVVGLTRNGRDSNTRQRAIMAVSTQLRWEPALVDAVEAALNDPDALVRGVARRVLYERERQNPLELEVALQVAADDDAPSTRRVRALQRLLQQAPADAAVLAAAERLAGHQDPVLRAGVVSMAGALPPREAEALLEKALLDPDPQVRAAAVFPLVFRRGADGETAQLEMIRRLLGDSAPEVQRNVLVAIRSNELNSVGVRAALRSMVTADGRVAQEGAALLDSLDRASRSRLQRFWDAAVEPENYGAFAFVLVAGTAALLCVGFLIYFTARFFVYLAARRWRAFAALGVTTAWVGMSFALGWAFFMGVLVAGGHNSSPPLGEQLSVVGILSLLAVVYGLVGFGLSRLIRA